MRWLIDEMFPTTLAHELRRRDHDAVSIAELDLRGAPDVEVFDLAVAQHRVVVTENFGDFAVLVEERQGAGLPVTPVVFVHKESFHAGGGLAAHLATRLDAWAADRPEPYLGIHWA